MFITTSNPLRHIDEKVDSRETVHNPQRHVDPVIHQSVYRIGGTSDTYQQFHSTAVSFRSKRMNRGSTREEDENPELSDTVGDTAWGECEGI